MTTMTNLAECREVGRVIRALEDALEDARREMYRTVWKALAEGVRPAHIARAVGISREHVYNIKKARNLTTTTT